jgi:peptidoglycan/xylan/chitin deacetylase (PgdA/CDA1 family)
VYRRRRLVAAGLVTMVLVGVHSTVVALTRPDPRAGTAQQVAAAGRAAGAKRVVPTQPRGPVDCRVTPCVALTFDDGPVPETAKLVDVLAERGVRATFFVIGQQAKRYPEVLQRAARAGDEIGNHSWSHIDLRSADAATVAKQLDRTSDVVEAATGVRPATMRPPYGEATKSSAAKAGLPQVLWSLDTRDWDGRSTSVVVRGVLADVQPGDIVLLHDSHAGTRAAAPVIADGLLRKGYALVTVSELLGTDLKAGRIYRSGPTPKH